MDNHDKVIKDAQYRKGLSIAFFNATNAAIELTKGFRVGTEEELINQVIKFRDILLEEHKNYYANVIAKIGVNYKPEETKKKLSKAKTVAELKQIWQSLSEDERQDPAIKAFTQALKKKYEKIQ